MEQSVQELCWLMQEVLYEQKHDFQITDSERLFQIAKENGLSGTVFEVLKNHGITPSVYLKFQKEFYLYVAQDEEQVRMIELIKGLLDANNIKHLFLKGSELKKLYPKSYMRAMGDIDFLVQEKDRQTGHELLERVGINLKSKGIVHDYYVSDSGINVEMHTRLKKVKNQYKDLERISDIVLGKDTIELHLLYLMYHLVKHLTTSGIGLRSVLDIGVYVQQYYDEIDLDKLKRLLVENSLDRLFLNVMVFNAKYLEQPLFDELAKGYETNETLFESFTTYVVLSGIHGWGVSFNHFSGLLSSNKNKRFNRLRSLLKIVFLPHQDLKYMFPRLLKFKIFLPLAWLLRGLNLVFKDRKIRKRKLQQLFDSNINIPDVSDMFEDLGI